MSTQQREFGFEQRDRVTQENTETSSNMTTIHSPQPSLTRSPTHDHMPWFHGFDSDFETPEIAGRRYLPRRARLFFATATPLAMIAEHEETGEHDSR